MKIEFLLSPFIAALISIGVSQYVLGFFFPMENQHVANSVTYYLILHLIINIILSIKWKSIDLIQLVMPLPVTRLILSGVVFTLYINYFTIDAKIFAIHFVAHYFIFTVVEMISLLKEVKSSETRK